MLMPIRSSVPETWRNNALAGRDWFTAFMMRNKKLSRCTPDATSLGRASSFNHHDVDKFFNNLETVMKTHKFEPSSISNVDETGVTTVQHPNKIVAQKGSKPVGKLTSAERGALDYCCLCS